jgi:hypothetical protein
MRPPLGSGEPKHLTLRGPVDWQRLGPRKTGARKRWRLPPFEDGIDDIRSQTAKPSELRKVMQREPLSRSDVQERSITPGGDRHSSSMGIGHQPDQAFVPPSCALGLKSRRYQPGLAARSDQSRNRVNRGSFVRMQLYPIAVDFDALDQRCDEGSLFMLGSLEQLPNLLTSGSAAFVHFSHRPVEQRLFGQVPAEPGDDQLLEIVSGHPPGGKTAGFDELSDVVPIPLCVPDRMARRHASAMAIKCEPGEEAWVLDVCATLARGRLVTEGGLDAVPQVTSDDCIMFPGVASGAVLHLADIDAVAQQVSQPALAVGYASMGCCPTP